MAAALLAALCSTAWLPAVQLPHARAASPYRPAPAHAPLPVVMMAKKAKKGKGGGGGGGTAAAEVDEAPAASGGAAEVDLDVVVSDAEERMKKSLSSVQEQLATLRVGRATPDMLDRVLVDYYDTPTPLKQLASVTCPTATQLVVDVYDKSALGDVEKGLMASDIGMTPSNDGSVIRLNVPQLTKDRRVELAKTAKGIGEGGKTALRNVRRDAIDKIKKAVKVA